MADISDARVLVLGNASDLDAAHADATWLGRARVDHVLLELPGLTERTRTQSALRVRRHINDCGCLWGEIALLAGIVTVWLTPVAVTAPVVLLVVLSAVAGKLLGLAWSRRQLRLDLRRLAADAQLTWDEKGGGRRGRNSLP
jgi:hypothetical protein